MDKNQLSVDMAGFDAADINVRETEKQGEPLLFHNMVLFNRFFSLRKTTRCSKDDERSSERRGNRVRQNWSRPSKV